MTPRFNADHRRNQIVQTATNLSYEGGLYDWTLRDIAEHVGLTQPGVKYYFYSAEGLRELIIRNAIRTNDVAIVTQALAKHDPIVDGISAELREACARYMTQT